MHAKAGLMARMTAYVRKNGSHVLVEALVNFVARPGFARSLIQQSGIVWVSRHLTPSPLAHAGEKHVGENRADVGVGVTPSADAFPSRPDSDQGRLYEILGGMHVAGEQTSRTHPRITP